MKVKKGLFRIYIVLSIMWSTLFLSFILADGINLAIEELYSIIMATLPVPLYFVLKWISDGFK